MDVGGTRSKPDQTGRRCSLTLLLQGCWCDVPNTFSPVENKSAIELPQLVFLAVRLRSNTTPNQATKLNACLHNLYHLEFSSLALSPLNFTASTNFPKLFFSTRSLSVLAHLFFFRFNFCFSFDTSSVDYDHHHHHHYHRQQLQRSTLQDCNRIREPSFTTKFEPLFRSVSSRLTTPLSSADDPPHLL